MSSSLLEVQPPDNGFDVRTVASDSSRASLCLCGPLDSVSATRLSEVITGHLRARRRFLRVDVAGLVGIDAVGLAVLVDAHRRVLSERGTLILMRVSDATRAAFA